MENFSFMIYFFLFIKAQIKPFTNSEFNLKPNKIKWHDLLCINSLKLYISELVVAERLVVSLLVLLDFGHLVRRKGEADSPGLIGGTS